MIAEVVRHIYWLILTRKNKEGLLSCSRILNVNIGNDYLKSSPNIQFWVKLCLGLFFRNISSIDKWFGSVPSKIAPYIVESVRSGRTFVPSNLRLIVTFFSLLNFSMYWIRCVLMFESSQMMNACYIDFTRSKKIGRNQARYLLACSIDKNEVHVCCCKLGVMLPLDMST